MDWFNKCSWHKSSHYLRASPPSNQWPIHGISRYCITIQEMVTIKNTYESRSPDQDTAVPSSSSPWVHKWLCHLRQHQFHLALYVIQNTIVLQPFCFLILGKNSFSSAMCCNQSWWQISFNLANSCLSCLPSWFLHPWNQDEPNFVCCSSCWICITIIICYKSFGISIHNNTLCFLVWGCLIYEKCIIVCPMLN